MYVLCLGYLNLIDFNAATLGNQSFVRKLSDFKIHIMGMYMGVRMQTVLNWHRVQWYDFEIMVVIVQFM
jgi:hypothetical protein